MIIASEYEKYLSIDTDSHTVCFETCILIGLFIGSKQVFSSFERSTFVVFICSQLETIKHFSVLSNTLFSGRKEVT